MFKSFVSGMTPGAHARVWVPSCEFLTLMACVEPSMYHLASEMASVSLTVININSQSFKMFSSTAQYKQPVIQDI